MKGRPELVTIKSKKEIELMREACKVVAKVYDEIEKNIRPGISTLELDQIAERTMRSLGAIPAEKGYDSGIRGIPPFPASICVSINDEVIHGIPSKYRILKEGDIVSVDTVALKNGFNGDAARTFVVGKTSKENQRLIDSFNAKEINSLFTVGMITEGVNLVDTQISIIIQLDGHLRLFIQKLGRVLRSNYPVVYIFVYKGNQDEIYLNKDLKNIN